MKRISKAKTRGFTLTELLAVILIMGMLAATLLPAFVTMTKTTGLDRAVFPLKGALRTARQHAMTHNTHVSVVFPHDPSKSEHTGSLDGLYGAAREKRLYLKSYNLYDHGYKHAGVGVEDGSWLGPWEYLPAGVVFNYESDPIEDGSINVVYTRDSNSFKYNYGDFPFPDNDSQKVIMPCITFRPDGSVISKNLTQYGIFIQNGTTNAESNPAPSALVVESVGDDIIGIKIHPLTGEMEVVEHFEQ